MVKILAFLELESRHKREASFKGLTTNLVVLYFTVKQEEDFINSMSPKKSGRWQDQAYHQPRYTLLAFSW